MTFKNVVSALALLLLAGCAHMLPTGSSITHSPWDSFENAKADYDKIQPGSTSVKQLRQLGFDPFENPNMKLVSYVDLIKFFIPNASIKMADLPSSVRGCLEMRDKCIGYEVDAREIYTKRYGSFLADFFQFKRKTKTYGWTFNALIVILDDTVAYKLWGGQPLVNTVQTAKKPLGPLQEFDFKPSVIGITF